MKNILWAITICQLAAAAPFQVGKDGLVSSGNFDMGTNNISNVGITGINTSVAPFNIFEARATVPAMQTTTSGTATFWGLFTADHDGTDTNMIRIYGSASTGPSAQGNDHFIQFGYNSAGHYRFQSLANGTEPPRELQISIGNDTIADATKANDILITAPNKSAGTGNGGDLILKSGQSAGGTWGTITFRKPNQTNDTEALKYSFTLSPNTWHMTNTGSGTSISMPVAGGVYITGDLGLQNNDLANVASLEIDDGSNAPYSIVPTSFNRLQVSRTTTGQSSLDLVSLDKDGTDPVGFSLFHVGEPGAANIEGLSVYSTVGSPATMAIQSFAAGTGVLRDIDFMMELTVVATIETDGDWSYENNDLTNVGSLELDNGSSTAVTLTPKESGGIDHLELNSSSGESSHLVLKTQDEDGTDNVGIFNYAVGALGDTDYEAFFSYYHAGLQAYLLRSLAGGTGVVRPISFYMGSTEVASLSNTGDWDFKNNDLSGINSITIDSGSNLAPMRFFEPANNRFVMQSQKAGASTGLSIYTFDHDGTDPNNFRVYGSASTGPSASGDDHYLQLSWNALPTPAYRIESRINGTMAPAPLNIGFSDDAIADAAKASSLTLAAANKTAGTGDGGDVVVAPGTSTGGTKGVVSVSSSLVSNVLDPVSAQDAATKNYVDTTTGFVAKVATQTTNNTPTTVNIFTLSDDTAYFCKGKVVAFSTDTSNQAMYEISVGVYRRSAGSCTIQGGVLSQFEESSDINWDATFICTSNDLELEVTGNTSQTVEWVGKVTCEQAS